MPEIDFRGNDISVSSYSETKLSINFACFEIGPQYTEYYSFDKPSEFKLLNIKDSITVASAECYLLYGLGISIDFRYQECYRKVLKIIEE